MFGSNSYALSYRAYFVPTDELGNSRVDEENSTTAGEFVGVKLGLSSFKQDVKLVTAAVNNNMLKYFFIFLNLNRY
ncbi:hypothetical protein LT679_13025 [Mucilaginibacter roseus]|uniref:Uncharacterized protein n=1 Tax=Mucilaginibacter roseus TaxID=1528868 RepID=A0ABS8U357_9SPHI|nr:hypothetical protein [Mucilaginibacter roseus]MCD8741531.1 hypothetical protein [Mucilaginibacter roseus]